MGRWVGGCVKGGFDDMHIMYANPYLVPIGLISPDTMRAIDTCNYTSTNTHTDTQTHR